LESERIDKERRVGEGKIEINYSLGWEKMIFLAC